MNTFNIENGLRYSQHEILRLQSCKMCNHAVWQLEAKRGMCCLKIEAHVSLVSSIYLDTRCHISDGCHFNYNLTHSNNGSHSSYFISNTTLRYIRMIFWVMIWK